MNVKLYSNQTLLHWMLLFSEDIFQRKQRKTFLSKNRALSDLEAT